MSERERFVGAEIINFVQISRIRRPGTEGLSTSSNSETGDG